jgi:hypothetical protein
MDRAEVFDRIEKGGAFSEANCIREQDEVACAWSRRW